MLVDQAQTDLTRLRAGWPAGSTLARMPDAALRDWLRRGRVRTFARGETLADEEETGATVFLLLGGCVKVVSRSPEEAESLLAVHTGGDLIGELTALDGAPRPGVLTACGTGPVAACLIDGAVFTAILAEHRAAMLALTASVARRLQAATRRLVDLARETPVRLARLIVELAEDYGHRLTDASYLITVDLTQQEIGNLMGASEPTVYRALKALRAKHMVETRARRLVITDLDALRAFADSRTPPRAHTPH